MTTYPEYNKKRDKLIQYIGEHSEDTFWQPYERKVSEIIIVSGGNGVEMNVLFVTSPDENILSVPYEYFLEENLIKEEDFLN